LNAIIQFQIGDNGIISLGKLYNHFVPQNFPLSSDQKIIAPYWADVDLRGIGNVFYRQTTDPVLIAKANSDIRESFPTSENVSISNLLIVTWDSVGYFPSKRDKVTFVHTMQDMCKFLYNKALQ